MGVTLHSQEELFAREVLWRDAIVAKLSESGRYDLASPLKDCRTQETICLCKACLKHHAFWNRCDLFYCPLCAPRLAYRRRLTIQFWTKTINQPKHLVLTARNRPSFSRIYVQWFKASWNKLRRSKFAKGWRGGLYALEVTNEGQGWHLHLHALIDADWIDAPKLSILWGKLVQQDFAIVAVRDVRERTYLQEVTKYAVKGSALASWSGDDIATFIGAFQAVRQFSVFGTLFKDRAKRKKIIQQLTPPKPSCPACGSTNLTYLHPDEAEVRFGV